MQNAKLRLPCRGDSQILRKNAKQRVGDSQINRQMNINQLK